MTVENAEVFAVEIEDKRWAMRIILPEITVAELMEFGAPLAFELYDDGYIREVIGAVHYVDHIRKEFRVKDAKGDTNFVRFSDIINVKNAPSG